MTRIFEIFTGEFVRVTLKRNLKQTVDIGGTIKIVENPKELEGYLVEEDDDHFYLGYEPDSIQLAMDKEDMSTMEFATPTDLQEDLLNQMVDETEKNGMN